MTRENYDMAYEKESKKFPAILRMTKVNRIILIILLVIYVGGSFALALFLGEGDNAVTLALIIAVLANMSIWGFAYKALTGNSNYVMQGIAMIVIPLWAIATFVVPDFKSLSNYLFILPLLWLEIMIIVEGIIHKKAQRKAMDLAEMEREHNRKHNGF